MEECALGLKFFHVSGKTSSLSVREGSLCQQHHLLGTGGTATHRQGRVQVIQNRIMKPDQTNDSSWQGPPLGHGAANGSTPSPSVKACRWKWPACPCGARLPGTLTRVAGALLGTQAGGAIFTRCQCELPLPGVLGAWALGPHNSSRAGCRGPPPHRRTLLASGGQGHPSDERHTRGSSCRPRPGGGARA